MRMAGAGRKEQHLTAFCGRVRLTIACSEVIVKSTTLLLIHITSNYEIRGEPLWANGSVGKNKGGDTCDNED